MVLNAMVLQLTPWRRAATDRAGVSEPEELSWREDSLRGSSEGHKWVQCT